MLSSTIKTIFKSEDVLWELNAHLPTAQFLWERLKKTTLTI